MKFFLIGDEETVLGFSLAGVESVVAESKDEIIRAFRQAEKRSDIGIFLITEKLAEKVRPFLDRMLLGKKGPLVLEIPDRQGPLPQRQSIEALVLSALGVKV